MSRAVAAETAVAYVAEVTENTTPATPAFKYFRAKSETLNIERRRVSNNELGGKRGEAYSVIASRAVNGSYKIDLSHATLDDLLEAALRSTWATNQITDANVKKTFTFETKYEAGGTDVFKRATGCQIDKLGLRFVPGQIAEAQFDWIGRGGDFASAIVAGATYAAGNTKQVHTSGDFSSLTVSGLTVDVLTELTINLNNMMREQRNLGSLDPSGLAAGKLEVTGSFGIFLDSANSTVLDAFKNGTATGLDFITGNTTLEKIRFEIPNVVIDDCKVNAENADGDVIAQVTWRALQASSLTNSVLRVTRNVA